jgi:hypothetical protein
LRSNWKAGTSAGGTEEGGHTRQALRQTDRHRQSDRLARLQSRCGRLGEYNTSKIYTELIKNYFVIQLIA